VQNAVNPALHRHSRDEPFAFVMAAQETIQPRIVRCLADEQQQMPLLGLALHYRQLQVVARSFWDTHFEELTVTITLDVHGIVSVVPPGWAELAHFHASFHFLELGLNLLCIHTV
jgi:hypothetical protein